jgi:diguanylate cyclase (GGDEF)-like protein
MGNPVQEILQGRGSEKRQDIWLKKGFPFFLLSLTYLGLLLELPSRKSTLWFPVSIITIAVYAILHIYRKDRTYALEFLFSFGLLIPGAVQALNLPWLRLVYFPFLVSLAAFYRSKTVLLFMIFIPLFEIKFLLNGTHLIEEIFLLSSLAATGGLSLLLVRTVKGTKAVKSTIHSRKITLQPVEPATEMKSFNDEKVISHYFESMFKPEDEIKELLMVAKNTIFADSITLFVSTDHGLRLRCSTDKTDEFILSDRGLIYVCLKEKRPLVSFDIIERKLDVGYLKKEKISSFVAVPIMDGTFPLGVVSADSARFHAFSSADTDTLNTFSNQLVKILQRERVYPQIYRSYTTLKVLNEESAKLLSSLNVRVIAQTLIDGTLRIAPSISVFFLVKGNEVEILHHKGLDNLDKNVFSLKNTVLDMVVKNKEPLNLSDVRQYRSSIMPFKINNIGSVFVLPLLYERDLLGILVILSEETNAFNPYQIELLKVLGNQASISIANAKFHEEIERLAITDGLTGLFNHRHFQERAKQEFYRRGRFPEPISLLFIDIDHFKEINDTYGHPVGDSVLKGVSDIIKKTIRNIDFPARYGGEEFAVILIGTDARGALKMAERLRKAIMKKVFSAEAENFQITVSIGLSTHRDDIRSKEELIEEADKALYHAKRTGRNRCVLWSDMNV